MIRNIVITKDIINLFTASCVQLSFHERFGPMGMRIAIKITNGAILCDIKIHNKGIALILRGYNNYHMTLYLNENIIFQKINDEEKILLKAIEHLSK